MLQPCTDAPFSRLGEGSILNDVFSLSLTCSRKGIYNPYVNEVLTLLSNDGRDDTVQYINGQLTHEKTEAAKKSMTFFSGNHLAAFPKELRQILQDEYTLVVYQNASL